MELSFPKCEKLDYIVCGSGEDVFTLIPKQEHEPNNLPQDSLTGLSGFILFI